MRRKRIFQIFVIGVMLLFIPIGSFANTVPWSSTQYTATVGQAWGGNIYLPTANIQSGSVPPVTATWYWAHQSSNASSTILSNSMYVQSTSNQSDLEVLSTAVFSGTYISDVAPFLFTYNGTYTSTNDPTCPDCYSVREHFAWLKITDLTNNNYVLYDNNSLTLDGSTNIVEIPTIGGHEIKVDFGAKAYTWIEMSPNRSTDTVTLNYSAAVAPEPISSLLFVTGGTLLAGRRYIKRKKKA